MADGPDITFHNTRDEVLTAWRSLVNDGGYSLYADADGNLHALRFGYDFSPAGS